MHSSLLDPGDFTGRSNGIDMIRGWCALHVLVLAHLAIWAKIVSGGSLGLDAIHAFASILIKIFQTHYELSPAVLTFIVLSGYCIHRNGLRPGAKLRPFIVRRTFRIMPVFVLAAILGIGFFYLSSNLNRELAMSLTGTTGISAACIAAKLSIVAAIVPIAHPCSYLGNAPLLTVMAEVALYAFYGVAMVVGRPWLVYAICGASVLSGLLVAAFNLQFPILYDWWQNSSAFAFLPYWWLGVAVLILPVREYLQRHFFKLAAAWVLLTIISQAESTAVASEARKLVFCAMVALGIAWIDRAAIRDNWLSAMGRGGYSIYALHAPLCIVLLLAGFVWWSVAIFAVCAGLLCYYLIEKPMNRRGQRLARDQRSPLRPADTAS
jgi:peptidoglycan/LPS O-acetylase OafA/YrhL